MALSDRIVYSALVELIEQHGSNAVISQPMISEAAHISTATTWRALHRLMSSGQIEGVHVNGIGYRYRIKDSAGSAAGTTQHAAAS